MIGSRRKVDEPAGPTGTWRENRGARILVETPDRAVAWADARVLEREGFDVACCEGPESLPGGRCPMVDGKGCHLADTADAVVFSLPLGRAESRAILAGHRRRRPDVPVCVDATPHEQAGHRQALAGTLPFPSTATGAQLVSVIRTAMAATKKEGGR